MGEGGVRGGAGLVFCGSLCVSCPPRLCIPRLASARQAPAGSGDGGFFYGRAVVRRVCGHVARRLAYQRGQVCQERLAIEFPAVPAALPAPECHAPRAAVRREATITARAGHRTRPVVFTPDAPPARPPLSRRFQVGPVRHASPEPPAVRGPLRRFLRRSQSLNSQKTPLGAPAYCD